MRSIQSSINSKLQIKCEELSPDQINLIAVRVCGAAHNIEKHFVASPRTRVFALTTILKYPIVVNILSKYLADGGGHRHMDSIS